MYLKLDRNEENDLGLEILYLIISNAKEFLQAFNLPKVMPEMHFTHVKPFFGIKISEGRMLDFFFGIITFELLCNFFSYINRL